jgi:glycosyltransferase involved in cell wall biosynthesis
MKKLLISVVLPTYAPNSAFLRESLESIVRQTYDEWEIVLIWDPHNGSATDHLFESVRDEHKDDHKIHFFMNRKRLGIVQSLNKALQLSTGSAIARMDDDDVSEPARFECQLEAMRLRNLDFCGSWALCIDDKGNPLGEIRTPIDPESVRKQMMLHPPFLHPTMMFDKRALRATGYYDPRMGFCQDYELYMRLISHGFVGGNVPRLLFRLRENPRSSTRNRNWLKARLDYNLVKWYGFTRHGYHKPYDFLFMFSSPAALVVPPSLINTTKSVFNLFRPSRK